MGSDQIPPDLLHAGSLKPLAGEIRPRQGIAFLVDWRGTRAILRSLPSLPGDVDASRLVADVRWLHTYLTHLTGLGFPAPRPLPAFGGVSWSSARSAIWELVTYLPGAAVGWSERPALEEIGALLARYHASARQIQTPAQRPTALPLADVPAALRSAQLEPLGISANLASVIRQLAERLGQDLGSAGSATRDQVVVHGDFTNDNVLASGKPPRATGVIDFALAHAANPMADIGYALWRSGRPVADASYLDLNRVRRYVHGYTSAAPLSADQASMIPAYLLGRGLQMIAKRIRAGQPEIGMLPQVQWLSAHARDIGDAIQQALR